MTKYIIDGKLREDLLRLTEMLTAYNFKGKHINISKIQSDLQNAEEVIEETDYNAKAEEFILIAKEMGLL